ncbi:PQQ-binding-like beta-propeller repeat protein [bacterium]|nr:PQQ-binding-like beta-propeller repeat protein [bacterium]
MKKWQKIGLACAVLFVIYLAAIAALVWHHYSLQFAHIRWKLDPILAYGASLQHDQPAVDAQGHVYLCLRGEAVCLNPDGGERWRSPYLLNYANVCHEVTPDGRLALCETLADNSGSTTRYHGVVTVISSRGQRLWQQPVEYKGDMRGNNVSGQYVFVMDEQTLYAFSLTDGTLAWELAIPATDNNMWPQVDRAGNLYYATAQSELVMVSPAGEEMWRRALPGCATYLPTPTDLGLVYVIDSANNLSAVSSEDGRLVWQLPLPSINYGTKYYYYGQTQAVANAAGQVCVVGLGGGLMLFDPRGQQLYQYDRLNWVGMVPALSSSGVAYLQDNKHGLLAIGPDGQVRWRNPTLASSQAQPQLAGGNLYVMHDGVLYALEP